MVFERQEVIRSGCHMHGGHTLHRASAKVYGHRHAEFLREGPSYLVKDVGSLNGTYVNRERIEEITLSSGDEVQIGKFKLLFLSTGAS